ncbi:MAG TPA: DNRLRE domain-containing protein, partial [Thermoanaerobaculia bacterium]|nr:DNRLRE domain-containing protein [Thermoanaerobaculia bacterium]
MRLLSRSAAVLAIAVLSFLLPPAAARAAVTAAHGDTYVTAATPGQNFATAPTLNVNPQSITLLKFDLTALPTGTTPTQIAKATLLLWVNPSSPNPNGSLAVVPVAKDWNGPAVTYANRPTTLASPKTTQALRPGASSYYLEVDVTEQVKKWITSPATNFGLAVTAATPAVDVALDSKEN